ncbi:aldo/keto reductase [Tolypothrix campylonemoides VB511288]|nr:aldo/keto reductase [Tolypothrix campylonemoides VB511288]
MRYKLLGKSGLRVSELCLGTMTFGENVDWGASYEESRKIFDTFIEAGGNFIDTANEIYTGGNSEKYLGEFIAADREKIVLATKYTDTPPTTDPNRGGNQRKSMVQSVERSLKRLKTDYIDLLWLHSWDFMTPVEEVMRAFDDLVRAGKVLYIGVSDAPAWVVSQANMLAQLRGWTPFIGLQIEYSLIERTPERELLPMARALDIGITGWSPLASGILTGKYSKKNQSQDSTESKRLEKVQWTEIDERKLAIADTVVQVAEEIGHKPSQVAINWVRSKGVIPILGATKLSQIQDNLACLDFQLSPEHIQKLDEVSKIELGFPHDFLVNTRGATFGGTFELIDNHRS